MNRLLIIIIAGLCLNGFAQKEDYYRGHNNERELHLGPQHSPFGFLGASGIFQVGKDTVTVKHVFKGGIAYEGGLSEGDIIIAANGKSFDKATDDVNDGGKGPREGLGMAMDEALNSDYKTLTLTVMRGDRKMDLTLYLSGMTSFSKNYPFYCQRSEEILENLCKKVMIWQEPNGGFGSPVITSTVCLGLLATGSKKYFKTVKRAAYHLVEYDLMSGGFPTWNYIFAGTFLCEYYLATGDDKVLKQIKNICDTLALKATSENGRHSHGIEKNPGYDGAGLNIITSQVFLVWALAEKCGIKPHEKQYKAVIEHLKRCTEANGGTGYIGPFFNEDGAARTALFTLALYISGEDKSLMKIQGKYLERHTRRMRECHANGLFGMFWGSAALLCVNPKGYRKHMDYWRWYMHMGQTPKGHDLVRYYIPSKKNNFGDEYLGWDRYNHATMLMVFAVNRKNLFIHSNTKRNWYKNKSGEPVVQFYNKIYKDKTELIEFLSTRKEEISTPSQINATIKFLKDSLRNSKDDKALELYKEVMDVVNNRIDMINKLAFIKPGLPYKFYKEFKEIFRYDRQITAALDERFKPLFQNRKIQELSRYTSQIDELFSGDFDPKSTNGKLENIKKNLKRFTIKNIEHRELCTEAQMLIEKIDRTVESFL
ncbi:MAG: DUF6288 domain-containing protein [Lentisphaeraceae bacterium]|nr:DUF6288 domain-containing protein [Lentisphaeraceae bacterium]